MRKLTLLAAGATLLVAAYFVFVWLVSGGSNDGCDDRNRQADLGPPPQRKHGPAPGGGATALGLGGNKSCAAMKDGGVWCWGDDVEYPARSGPSLLTDLLNREPGQARALFRQDPGYSCVLSDQQVRCWDLSAEHRLRDVAGPEGKDFVALWSGSRSACAKHATGHVECWADGPPWTDGQQELPPTPYAGLEDVDDLIILEHEVWARRGERVAWFRGRSELDELRTRSAKFQSSAVVKCGKLSCAQPVLEGEAPLACWTQSPYSLRDLAEFGLVTSVTGSATELCAKRNGKLTCETCNDLSSPAPSARGADRACHVELAGTVLCDADHVPQGNGLLLPRAPAHRLAGVASAAEVLSDSHQVCVHPDDADWACWALLHEGRPAQPLSDGWQLPSAPGRSTELNGAKTVAVNRFALCAIDAGAKATCFARTPTGGLKDPLTLPNTRKLAVGNVHACAVGAGGSLDCWGANESGQAAPSAKLGVVSAPNGILSGVVDVAVGLRHTCVVTRERGVVCFGDNHLGQLGAAPPLADATVPITGITPAATAVVAGFVVTCALTTSGTVFCWGGLDRQGAPRAAYQVSGLPTSALQLAAGGDRVCAVLADHRVACWLGYGAPPKLVPETEGSVEVAVGDDHACVRDAGGRMRCWGSNEFGQSGVEVRAERSEITPPHSCPQISYQVTSSSDEAREVSF